VPLALSSRRDRGQVFGKIVGSGLGVLLGIGALWFGIWNQNRVRAADSWPVVQGVIDSSSVATSSGRRGRTTYRCKVAYHFSVGGKAFTGENMDPTGNQNESSTAAQDHVRRYPKGGPCTVHYDPADPSASCLELGTTVTGWIFVLVGLGMVLGCGFAFAKTFLSLGRI